LLNLTLIDADSIYFRQACVTKNKNDIRKGIDHMMNQIRRDCMSDDLLVAVKGHGNFRKDLYPKYKANRKPQPDDMKEALTYGHEYMCSKWDAVMADDMEADDLVSIWAYEAREEERPYVIAGIDKDLLQIPGNHYNFAKKIHSFVDDDTANYNLMIQCLTGDGTDNIPGIKGVGPKKAEKILAGVPMERRWNRVRASWRGYKAGSPNISYDLLRMLTTWKEHEDIKDRIASQTSVRQQDVLEGKAE